MATAVATSCNWNPVTPHERAKTCFYVFYEAAKNLSCLTGKEVYVLNEGRIWDKLGQQMHPHWEFVKFKPESVKAIREVFVLCHSYVETLREAEGSDFLFTFYAPGGSHDEITHIIGECLPPVEIPRSRTPPG